ncbi:MAG: hypothetical protein NVS2B15_14480 [Pseudarthrobacter sp.]
MWPSSKSSPAGILPTSGSFPGALLYTQYNFLKRQLMKKITKDKGSTDLDTSRDYVSTEWDGVKRFTEDFLAGVPEPSGQERDEIA